MSPAPDELAYNTVLILSAFAAGARYGLEAIERTGLSSGTVYPALRRLEAAGLLVAEWEDEDQARDEGRPARRYYRLTGEGGAALAAGRERIHARQRSLGWADEATARG
jgi:DNA-binding PadR family transcriptional regulator